MGVEEVMLEVECFEAHFGVEDVFLIEVDVHHFVLVGDVAAHEVLDGVDGVVDVEFVAINVAGEAAHTVVECDDVGFELVDEVVECF